MHSKILRTFIGISAPKKCWDIKQMLISTMENENIEIKWVRHLNLHLTLKFIGDTPENDIKELSNELRSIIRSHNSFNLSINGTGCFPNEQKPSVLYLGIKNDQRRLIHLYNDIENFFFDKGYLNSKNEFLPHITIARIKYPQKNLSNFTSFLNSSYDSIDFPVKHLQFFSSELLGEGVFYNLLDTFPLGK